MEATIDPSLLTDEQISEIRELYIESVRKMTDEWTFECGIRLGTKATLQALFGDKMFNQDEE